MLATAPASVKMDTCIRTAVEQYFNSKTPVVLPEPACTETVASLAPIRQAIRRFLEMRSLSERVGQPS